MPGAPIGSRRARAGPIRQTGPGHRQTALERLRTCESVAHDRCGSCRFRGFLVAVESSGAHPLVDTPAPPGSVDQPLPSGAVARIDTRLVARRSYKRWFLIAAGNGRLPKPRSQRHASLRRETMEFLIEGVWGQLEAREHGITVSRTAARRAFRRQKRQSFSTERAYRRFLKRAKATEADLLYRVKLDLLSDRLTRHVASEAGGTTGDQPVLERFIEDFDRKWRARTACARGYVITDCSREVPTLPSARAAPAALAGS